MPGLSYFLFVVTFLVLAALVYAWGAYNGRSESKETVVIDLPGIKLPPAELRAAFNVADTNRLWVAVLQVIDDVQGEAIDGAQKSVASHGICASCVGGTEFLTRLRDRMILEREAAIKQPVPPAT